jgi:hypothetical protein
LINEGVGEEQPAELWQVDATEYEPLNTSDAIANGASEKLKTAAIFPIDEANGQTLV